MVAPYRPWRLGLQLVEALETPQPDERQAALRELARARYGRSLPEERGTGSLAHARFLRRAARQDADSYVRSLSREKGLEHTVLIDAIRRGEQRASTFAFDPEPDVEGSVLRSAYVAAFDERARQGAKLLRRWGTDEQRTDGLVLPSDDAFQAAVARGDEPLTERQQAILAYLVAMTVGTVRADLGLWERYLEGREDALPPEVGSGKELYRHARCAVRDFHRLMRRWFRRMPPLLARQMGTEHARVKSRLEAIGYAEWLDDGQAAPPRPPGPGLATRPR